MVSSEYSSRVLPQDRISLSSDISRVKNNDQPYLALTFGTQGDALSAVGAGLFISRQCPTQIPGKTAALPGKEEILDAIGNKELAHDPHLHFQIKSWNARPGSVVALVYITASVSDALDEGDGVEVDRAARLQPTLVLLESVNGRWIASARYSGPHGFGNHCRELPREADQVNKATDTPGDPGPSPDGDLCKEFDFDFTSYRITPTEAVISVRTKFHSFYIAGEGEYILTWARQTLSAVGRVWHVNAYSWDEKTTEPCNSKGGEQEITPFSLSQDSEEQH